MTEIKFPGPEQVDHPDHYGGAENPYEVIKVMEAWLTPAEFVGALKFNIHKYFARADKKGGAADYKKGSWYATYLRAYLHRCPPMGKVEGAVAKQLNRSMELNARMKNEVRRIQGIFDVDSPIYRELNDILRMS